MHGFLDNGMTWLIKRPANKNLPFVLAEIGYDVWIGSIRGTIQSN